MSSDRPRDRLRRTSDQIIDWLLAESNRRCTHAEMVEGLAKILASCGVPIWVLSSSQQTYQPEVSVLNARWTRGQGLSLQEYDYVVTGGSEYQQSPLYAARESDQSLRLKLSGDPEAQPYPICRSLAAQGGTDYFILTVPREFGAYASFATDAAGGFKDEHIALFREIFFNDTATTEIYTTNWGRDSLLNLYLGRNAASHVMRGAFRLGKREDIEAVIWMCDLRGFTALTESAPMDEVLQALNQYFACVVGPIRNRGGEVLKFIGDAVLAIFPVSTPSQSDACQNALDAARESIESLDTLNEERTSKSLPPLNFGIALHHGVVSYGNIGTPQRLDFTVIGSAVNDEHLQDVRVRLYTHRCEGVFDV